MTDSDRVNLPREGETLPHQPPSGTSADDFATSAGRPSTASPQPAPALEGYEVLEELGRGGMGVVYKARDLKLDRTVALKVIIGGRLASDVDIQRFRLEAESAARLDHGAIVPIYEIGEHEGNHFFAMKHIEGGSLSNANERYRGNPRSAVQLLLKVAQAVQHAHERGVLHRDLKPANILIDDDGNPSVTDLGLAKRMDAESELTHTGQAMGTPGFMAPEQAQGRRDITTAADIFSLGAILYWLQTGEAPFKGETVVDALVSTLNDEVPSLRSIDRSADGDLDLICQKAMHRDPAKRYASAAAFANDLQAWLNGEILSVRAPTAVSLASIWVRKNLRTVLGATATGVAGGFLVGALTTLDPLRNAVLRENYLQQLGHGQNAWVSYFSAVGQLGNGWQAIQLLIVPVIAICAFVNVLITRPSSREASMISSATAALAAGAVAYLVGLGWGPINQASIDRGAQDIELLANAIWLETPKERELAQLALIQRYPGLETLDQNQRQSMTLMKITHDQEVGILPGTWWGVGFAITFVALPMFATCVLSGVAWRNGMRGWLWFGCTMERCAYCLIFFLIIGLCLAPVKPAAHIVLLSLAALAFCLYVALKGSHWAWRAALAVTPFFCMFFVEGDVALMRRSPSAAGLAKTAAELRPHALQMNRLVALTHEPFVHYKVGIAWLSMGDEQEYRQHCRELHSRFDNAFRPEIAGRLAKLCLLRPDLQPEENLPVYHKLAELASSFESSQNKHWFFLTRAISEQRQGNAKDVLRWNERAREVPYDSTYLIPCTHLVDALAHLDLQDPAAAKESLRFGREARDEVRGKSFNDGHDVGWVDWSVFQIFEAEVEQRLNGTQDNGN